MHFAAFVFVCISALLRWSLTFYMIFISFNFCASQKSNMAATAKFEYKTLGKNIENILL